MNVNEWDKRRCAYRLYYNVLDEDEYTDYEIDEAMHKENWWLYADYDLIVNALLQKGKNTNGGLIGK